MKMARFNEVSKWLEWQEDAQDYALLKEMNGRACSVRQVRILGFYRSESEKYRHPKPGDNRGGRWLGHERGGEASDSKCRRRRLPRKDRMAGS